jgi:hypothetical protein
MPVKCPCKDGWGPERCQWRGTESTADVPFANKPDGVRFWILVDDGIDDDWRSLVCEAAGKVILRAQVGTIELALKLFRDWAGHE